MFPAGPKSKDVLARGRRSVAVDLKSPDGIETVLKMVEQADVLWIGASAVESHENRLREARIVTEDR